jgi:hypothetical protein
MVPCTESSVTLTFVFKGELWQSGRHGVVYGVPEPVMHTLTWSINQAVYGIYNDVAVNGIYNDVAVNGIYNDVAVNGVYNDVAVNGIYNDVAVNGIYNDVERVM